MAVYGTVPPLYDPEIPIDKWKTIGFHPYPTDVMEVASCKQVWST